jgi:hypothetical protein
VSQRSGQCLCGSVQFSIAVDPLAVRICWCRDCQHLAANGSVNVLIPSTALSCTGALSEHTTTASSGNRITRQFCPVCGTHLFARSDARPQFRVVRAGNLENPSSVQPTVNIWAASAPTWACLDTALECVESQPMPPGPPPTATPA